MNRQSELLKKAFSYQDSLTAYAYVVLQDWNLAEDVVQDALMKILSSLDQFEGRSRLPS